MSDKFNTSEKFKELVATGRPASTRLVKHGEPEDDPAFPAGYQAVRHVRTYAPSDAKFRQHGGRVHSFPWIRLVSWVGDGTGSRLTFVWGEMGVTLLGRNLHTIEDGIDRRIIGEFRQIAPGQADSVPVSMPVIELIQFERISDLEESA